VSTAETDLAEARPVAARCDETHLHVDLADGRRVSTPLSWYPRLATASPAERAVIECGRFGLHWPTLDEDLSVEGMLRGWKARGGN
jgi:hypothetical protein